MTRGMSLFLLVVTATLWGGVLGVVGLWLALEAPRRWPEVAPLCAVGGLVAAAAGGLVFACFSADRLAPRAWRPAVWAAELGACAAVFLGIAWLVLAGLAALGPLV